MEPSRLQYEWSLAGQYDEDYQIGKTSFFREPNTWMLAEHAEQRPPMKRPIQILQVGCSTGRETYSIALSLEEAGIDYRILAVELSDERVEFAKLGKYQSEGGFADFDELLREHIYRDREQEKQDIRYKRRIHEIGEPYAKMRGGIIQMTSVLRDKIEFKVGDVRDMEFDGPFDYIVCNNVLEHYRFDEEERRALLGFLAQQMGPESILMTELDKTDDLNWDLCPHYRDMHDPVILGSAGLEEIGVDEFRDSYWINMYRKLPS